MKDSIFKLKTCDETDLSFVRKGGSAYVFCLKRTAALKVFDKHGEFVCHVANRWAHERQMSTAFGSHPHIVSLEAIEEDDRFAVATLSILAHGDGFDLLETPLFQNGFPWDKMVHSAVPQLCSAVHHIHQHGILHRDIKLDNVLWRRDAGEHGGTFAFWLTDFGLATTVEAERADQEAFGDDRLDRSALENHNFSQKPLMPKEYKVRDAEKKRIKHTPDGDVWMLGVALFGLATGGRLVPRWVESSEDVARISKKYMPNAEQAKDAIRVFAALLADRSVSLEQTGS